VGGLRHRTERPPFVGCRKAAGTCGGASHKAVVPSTVPAWLRKRGVSCGTLPIRKGPRVPPPREVPLAWQHHCELAVRGTAAAGCPGAACPGRRGAACRRHAPVPVLAPGLGRTSTGRLWAYLRDERPRLHQAKFLNTIVEQDHRRVKRLVRPGLGFGASTRRDEGDFRCPIVGVHQH
jgi:hypothetical protein